MTIKPIIPAPKPIQPVSIRPAADEEFRKRLLEKREDAHKKRLKILDIFSGRKETFEEKKAEEEKGLQKILEKEETKQIPALKPSFEEHKKEDDIFKRLEGISNADKSRKSTEGVRKEDIFKKLEKIEKEQKSAKKAKGKKSKKDVFKRLKKIEEAQKKKVKKPSSARKSVKKAKNDILPE